MRLLRSTLIAAGLLAVACLDAPTKPTTLVDGGVASPTRVIPRQAGFRGVASGNAHSCAATYWFAVRCWGANDEGQAPPELEHEHILYHQISAGTHDNTCALRGDYSVLPTLLAVECFGRNDVGQSPGVIVAQASSFRTVDAGYSHACALRADGVVECWGGDPETYAPPVWTATVGTFTAISAGEETTCALRSDGVAECIGVDGLPGLHEFSTSGKLMSISAGRHFACGARGNGVLVCRGVNTLGQAPRHREAVSRYVEVSVGDEHGCALRRDGVIDCWGNDADGQAPASRKAAANRFVSVSAGAAHTCAVRVDLKAECWGSNSSGQATLPPYDFFFAFRGFFSQQLTAPTGQVNHVVLYSGGRTLTLKFGLGSFEGMDILAPGYPQVAPIDCAAPTPVTTGNAATGSLSYSASEDLYAYAWRAPGEMINTCQQLILKLTDGNYRFAKFRFTTHPVGLVEVGGNHQETAPPLLVMPTITLQAQDQYGVGVAGMDVAFDVTQGDGSVAAATGTTDARGFVVVPKWTLGLPGPHTLRATLEAASGNLTTDLNVTALEGVPDRAVETFFTDLSPLHPGDHFYVFYHVKNVGSAVAVASSATVRLSTDATITALDAVLRTVPVPYLVPGQDVSQYFQVTLPDTLAVGSYHVGILVEDHPSLPESDLSNNIGQAAAIVAPTFLSLPNRLTAAGLPTFCALAAAGSPYCWGKNDRKQFGTPATSVGSSSPVAAPLPALVHFARGASDHACGFDVTGAASCWGRSDNGVLGNGAVWSTSTPSVPVPVSGSIDWAQITTSLLSTCGVSTTGTGYCWGSNQEGEVGSASVPTGNASATVTSTTPRVLDGGLTWTSVVAGWKHACGIVANGDAYCWGSNSAGQLGLGWTGGNQLTPRLVAGGLKFIQLATTALSTCGITRDHWAYCWGKNTHGQLGNGTRNNRDTPVKVDGQIRFSLIAGGSGFADAPGAPATGTGTHGHVCALSEDGRAYCWGLNYQGQLGTGTTDTLLRPTSVFSAQSFTGLALTGSTTCAMQGTGIWCWGSNHEGQLGNGNTTGSLVPVQVLSPFNSP